MRHNVDPAVEIDVQHVLNAIRRIVQALRQASKHTEKTLGLSAAQLFVLQEIAESGTPLSINALAQRTLTHQSSVSVVVTKLVRLELIERLSSKTDARAVELRLTQKGEALLRALSQILLRGRLRASCHSSAGRLRSQLVELLGYRETLGLLTAVKLPFAQHSH